MFASGYEQTSEAVPRDVCFPLESRRRRPEFRRVGVLRPLTAPKQKSEAPPL